eukprot:IDg9768t1
MKEATCITMKLHRALSCMSEHEVVDYLLEPQNLVTPCCSTVFDLLLKTNRVYRISSEINQAKNWFTSALISDKVKGCLSIVFGVDPA